MQLHEIGTQFIQDTLASLWPAFAPELILCVTIMAMLIVRLLPGGQRIPGFLLPLIGALLAFYHAAPWTNLGAIERQELFTGMLVYDPFTVFLRSFLLVFVILFAVFTRLTHSAGGGQEVPL